MNQNEILIRLKNGENIDVIAKELTETLNAAKESYEAELAAAAKAEAEKVKKEAEAKAKLVDAEAIAELLNDFVKAHYPEHADQLVMTGKELVESFDAIFALTDTLNEFGKLFGMPIPAKTKSADPIDNITKDDATSIIKDFLKTIGC